MIIEKHSYSCIICGRTKKWKHFQKYKLILYCLFTQNPQVVLIHGNTYRT